MSHTRTLRKQYDSLTIGMIGWLHIKSWNLPLLRAVVFVLQHFTFVWFGFGATPSCFQGFLIHGSARRDHSWWSLRNHMECWGSNSGWEDAKWQFMFSSSSHMCNSPSALYLHLGWVLQIAIWVVSKIFENLGNGARMQILHSFFGGATESAFGAHLTATDKEGPRFHLIQTGNFYWLHYHQMPL